MAARRLGDMLWFDGSTIEPHGWSHTMNLMLATLTARDRFDEYIDQAAVRRLAAPVTTRRGGRIGLRQLAGSLAGRLRLSGHGAGA